MFQLTKYYRWKYTQFHSFRSFFRHTNARIHAHTNPNSYRLYQIHALEYMLDFWYVYVNVCGYAPAVECKTDVNGKCDDSIPSFGWSPTKNHSLNWIVIHFITLSKHTASGLSKRWRTWRKIHCFTISLINWIINI